MTEKFLIATVGCRTNQYESQAYRKQLLSLGFTEAKEKEAADIVIVNTCSVTHSADAHSRLAIRRLQRESPEAKIVVTGCLAQKLKEDKEFAEKALFVPNQSKEELLSYLYPDLPLPEFSIDYFAAHTRPFIKIQDGCNQFCSYCLIPYVRGRSRSRDQQKIVDEVTGLVASGVKEVVLTGINVGDYQGTGEGERLASLVRAVASIDGLKRVRISSIDPHQIDDDLIDLLLQEKRCCPSLHLVLQSGSNLILKRMNRSYSRQTYLALVDRLKEAQPAFTFTTDILVGFPGETEADVQDTLDVMERVQFAKVHVFPFSKRERTKAALFSDQLPEPIINERRRRVMERAEEIAFTMRERFVGQTTDVLLENRESDHFYLAHTENFLPVLLPQEGLAPNQLVTVTLTENRPEGLVGRCL